MPDLDLLNPYGRATMTKRTLALKREPLGDLSTDDLRAVNAGAPPTKDCAETVVNGCAPTFQYSCLNCISHPPCTID